MRIEGKTCTLAHPSGNEGLNRRFTFFEGVAVIVTMAQLPVELLEVEELLGARRPATRPRRDALRVARLQPTVGRLLILTDFFF